MTTARMLMLLVGAASTTAFTPPEYRSRRSAADGPTAASGATSGAASGAASFATAGSASSGSGTGFGPGFGSYSSTGGTGTGAFPYYTHPNSYQQYVPFDFQAAFQDYFGNMQRAAAQHNAYAANFFGPGGNSLDSGYGAFSGSSSGFGAPASGFAGPQTAQGGFARPHAAQGGFAGPQGGFAGPQGGFAGPQRGFAGTQGGFAGPQGGFAGPQAAFAGPGTFAGHGAFGANQGAGSPVYEDSDGGPVGAQASVNLDARGGFAEASVVPDLGSRIAEDLPAPSGGTYGVFTSSSSGSSNINGKKTSYKTATVGVNDNGKVTSYTV